MRDILNERKLYIALSNLFIDNEIDDNHIASVAKLFPIKLVKTVLFNYVAPACYYNTTAPVSSVYYFFDADELIHKIDGIKKREKHFINKIKMSIFSVYLELKFYHEWKTLKSLL